MFFIVFLRLQLIHFLATQEQLMTQTIISDDGTGVVFFQLWTTPTSSEQTKLLQAMKEKMEMFKPMPGFISMTLHPSLDGKHLGIYAQWRSRADFENAVSSNSQAMEARKSFTQYGDIAIMLGAEVGTCADTLVATVGRGRAALRTGVFHFLFNLVSAILGIIFAPLLVQLVGAISGEAGVGRQVANAQILFNLIGVAVVIVFLPLVARLLERLIPDVPQQRQLRPESATSAS